MDIGDKLFIHLQYERQQIVAENSSPVDLGPRENVAMTLDTCHTLQTPVHMFRTTALRSTLHRCTNTAHRGAIGLSMAEDCTPARGAHLRAERWRT